MLATKGSTLYPKITQHVSEVVRALKQTHHDSEYLDKEAALMPIPLEGSVKLHGTHADIVIHSDSTVMLQSKNVPNITTANDNHGFAAAMADKTDAILDLRNQYLVRWRELNAGIPLSPQYPVVIAGEWIGANIQKDVAISQLSRRFVVISVNINNAWIQDTLYPSVEAPLFSIYNVSRGGIFHSILYPDDIARTLAVVEPIAETIATSCPFAASFDIHGEGEGIVWKPSSSQLNSNPNLWFKTKSGRFRPTFAPVPNLLPVNQQEKHNTADAVAAIWCTEERLQQGWDYMEEVGLLRDIKGLGKYLKWIQTDILTEEKRYIEEFRVDEVVLRASIAKNAKVWYMRRVDMGKA